MKKGNLLVLAVPAMLLAVSCGAGTDQKTSIANKTSSNDDEIAVTIVCKSCVVNYDSKTYSVFTGKATTGKTFECNINADAKDPDALLPEKEDVDFREGGSPSTEFTFNSDETKKNASFSFKAPSSDVSVVIDATVQCVDFAVDLSRGGGSEEEKKVEFGFNGAISRVDWGDGSTPGLESSHKYKEQSSYPIKVYGKLSSIWFTEKDEPTSNSSTLLADGNKYLTSFNIHHSVRTLPNYALNGCDFLSNVYIGRTVETIGKKVFQVSDYIYETRETIYCYATSKQTGWDNEWTDCPVCYGVTDPDEIRKTHLDATTKNFMFRIVHAESSGRPKRVAEIVGIKLGGELTELTIPTTVKDDNDNSYSVYSIAPFAFRDLGDQLKGPISFASDNMVNDIGDYAFCDLRAATRLDFGNISQNVSTFRIGRSAFKSCYTIQEIAFPNYDQEGADLIIDDEAFYEVSQLKSIAIPANSFKLREIHKGAFQNCYQLSSITCEGEDTNFPTSVTTIGDMAFAYCHELLNPEKENPTIITITENVTKMGEYVFLNSRKDASIRVAYEEGKVPSGWSTNWNRIDKKEDVWIAVSWGFVKEIIDTNGCVYEITKNNDVKTATLVKYNQIKTNAGSVVIPEYVVDPDDQSKQYQVVAIGSDAFNGRKEILSVTVPKSVVKVGRHAFSSCSPMLKVFYGGSAEDVKKGWDEEWTFPNINNMDVGAALYTNYDSTIPQTDLLDSKFDIVKEVTPENGTYNASILNYVQSAGKVTIPATISDSSGKNSYNITSIGGKSFMRADLTNGLEFASGNKLTSIGAGAFAQAKLSADAMTLPKGITEIGCGAFALTSGVTSIDCSATQIKSIPLGAFVMAPDLTTVALPAGVNVETYAFTGCPKLEAVNLADAKLTDDIVPEMLFAMCTSYKGQLDEDGKPTGNLQLPIGIKSIGSQAFALSGVEKVVLTKNVDLTFIGDSAFAGCANLESITLPEYFQGFGENALGFGSDKNAQLWCSSLSEIDLSAITAGAIKIPPSLFGGKEEFLPEAFKQDGDGKIYVPSKFVDTYKSYFKDVLGEGNLDHIQAK